MIRQIPLFKDLSDAKAAQLATISITKSYKKGEFLFMEGEEPQWLSVLLKGTVKIYKTTPKGKEIFLATIRPVNFIAELVNFENIPYPASGVFLSNSEVLRIDYSQFKARFMSDPEICHILIKSLSQKLLIMNSVIQNELTLKSDAKVAKLIAENAEIFGSLKHIQIAQILNITPETFSRIITHFKQQNLIKFDENMVIVYKNDEKLREIFEI